MKDCGILLHISSLSGSDGIGSMGEAAYQFVDWLVSAKHKYWQVLPLGQTSYGDSPYQTFSTRAGNPYFIDLEICRKMGVLEGGDDCEWQGNYIEYGELYSARSKTLARIDRTKLNQSEFDSFCAENAHWLDDYALFMALKKHHDDRCWAEWDDGYRLREPAALQGFVDAHASEVEHYRVLQYLFFKQWDNLKAYANGRGVEIIGDMPIYVAYDSADVWAHPQLFHLDSERRMVEVAGVPPDYFSASGQLWGNPLYDWQHMESDGYAWWLGRIKAALELYDVVRIDHFRGFDSYWAIPFGNEDARIGEWKRGPALKFFEVVNEFLPNARIIAEDLGEKSDSVIQMLKGTGYPGMKILQFGLTGDDSNEHLPANYTENYVAYTGTHDNDTMRGWFDALKINARTNVYNKFVAKPAGDKTVTATSEGAAQINEEHVVPAFIDMLYASNARTAIIPVQDVLGLGSETRINIPSTLGGNNWRWRLEPNQLTAAHAEALAELATKHGRTLIRR